MEVADQSSSDGVEVLEAYHVGITPGKRAMNAPMIAGVRNRVKKM